MYIVANRLPVTFDGTAWVASPGGLVAALLPVASNLGATWVGWPGTDDARQLPDTLAGVRISPVHLSATEIDGYYLGFANSVLWPLAHGRPDLAEFSEHRWIVYRAVNKKFAEHLAELVEEGATVWVHDYHLMLLPSMLRELRPDLTIGFFLHTPAVPPAILRDTVFGAELMRGLSGADLVGVQSAADARDLSESSGLEARVFAISIDPEPYLADLVADDSVGAFELATVQAGTPLFLSVDRLDYSKGILERMRAFELLLERGACPDAVLLQVLTPTRESVPAYKQLRREVDELTVRINARFGGGSRPVIHNIYANLPTAALIGLYRAADVLVVSSLRDGMNLVAKEFVASRTDERGALVLSEFAGAADELTEAIIVDPYDAPGFAQGLLRAFETGEIEQLRRMQIMRSQVLTHTADRWADSFLQTLARIG